MTDLIKNLSARVKEHLIQIYPDHDINMLADQLIHTMGLDELCHTPLTHHNHWSEQDVAMITYGNSIVDSDHAPLVSLHHFLQEYLIESISIVHILPFFPYCADDGFSIINYREVNPALGNWHNIERISRDFTVMADVVINHCSYQSEWFTNFIECKHPGKDFFIDIDCDYDMSKVVRPRTSSLLRETDTKDGLKNVWCTFSLNQVDLNFSNPDVLNEIVSIVKFYLDHGIKVFRLDAIAFIWKESGSSCINLPQAHEIVRLLRSLIEHSQRDAIIITETNVPNHENLSYFGNANEAHCVYNFSLPPLTLNTLLTGNARHLRHWLTSIPQPQEGTTYFNFLASHDGIGLRPAEGLLSAKELENLAILVGDFGGKISWRATSNGSKMPYELNIALFDALKGTVHGQDTWQIERFICAHSIMLALQGIPAFYVHSLLGTKNDYDRMHEQQHNRAINRHQWDYNHLVDQLKNPGSDHARVLSTLTQLIRLRKTCKAFHPNALQQILQLNDQILGFWRQSNDKQQLIVCLFNITDTPVSLCKSETNLIEHCEYDIITQVKFEGDTLRLNPYQSVWLEHDRSPA